MEEIWKDIKGYEGLYQISNKGRVWSVRKQKYMKPYYSGGNMTRYNKVDLIAKNGKRKKEYVHRLVALNFIPNPSGYTIVNHIDGNKINNCVENLEWCSSSYNSIHSYYTLNNTKSQFTAVPCKCLETEKEYCSVAEAARDSGLRPQNIQAVLDGYRKTTFGTHWVRL